MSIPSTDTDSCGRSLSSTCAQSGRCDCTHILRSVPHPANAAFRGKRSTVHRSQVREQRSGGSQIHLRLRHYLLKIAQPALEYLVRIPQLSTEPHRRLVSLPHNTTVHTHLECE